MKQVSIPTTETAQIAWRRFKTGIACFATGTALIFVGYWFMPLLQLPGLLVLAVGSGYAIVGYLGILRFRLSSLKKLKQPPRNLK
ncbi:MAG: hypothetical protein ACFHVJ_04070 [Aestuariibacter sp.]